MTNAFDRTEYPEGLPSTLVAGDRWTWKRADLSVAYPTSDYSMKYSLRLFGTGSTEIEVTATEADGDYYFEVASATTAAYAVGVYSWQLYAIRTSDSERLTLERGRVEVLANRDTSAADPRTHNKRMMDTLETAIESLASKVVTSYSIGDRSLTYADLPELREQYDIYSRRVENEERLELARLGKGGGRRVRVRFG